jgi:hypothetical protein
MKSKWAVAAAVIIAIAVIIAVALMMNRDGKPAEYRIEDERLVISCSFGVSVPLEEICALEITETAPGIGAKTNGASIGSMHKGEYKLADGSAARLYIDDSIPLFIRFTQGDTVFYLNSDTVETTQALFDQLREALG